MNSLQELARKSGVNVTPEANPSDLVQKAKEKAAPKNQPGAKKKATAVKVRVDDAWIADLTQKANDKFGNSEQFGKASIEFTIAKSKGRMVSLTPKLVMPDGTVKSAGSKHRMGFCTNGNFDKWYNDLEAALTFAYTAERSPIARKPSKKWLPYAEAIGKMENPPEVKPVSGKLSVRQEDSKVTLKMTDGLVTVSSASGTIVFLKSVLEALQGIEAAE